MEEGTPKLKPPQKEFCVGVGLDGVFVRPFPFWRHHEFGTTPVPGTVRTRWVTWDEWCNIHDSIGPQDTLSSTDLFVDGEGVGLCNLYDPHHREWVLLPRGESGVPFTERTRLPKPKPWLPLAETTG